MLFRGIHKKFSWCFTNEVSVKIKFGGLQFAYVVLGAS